MDIGEDIGMTTKILGALFVVASCASVGFRIAANYRAEERYLRNLIGILDYMECELRYRLTPLPVLCRRVAADFPNTPGKFFEALAQEMDAQLSPDMESCVSKALCASRNVPKITRSTLELFGKTVGRFDMEGQLKGLDAVRSECKRNLDILGCDRDSRLRSYQTLGLCAGASLAILLI